MLVSGCSSSQAEHWNWAAYPSFYCPNAEVTSSCPGGPISADYRGLLMYTLRNDAQGDTACAHANDTTSWDVQMQASCGDASSTFVPVPVPGTSDEVFFVSVKYNNENNCRGYLYPANGQNNADLIIGDTCADPGSRTDWTILFGN